MLYYGRGCRRLELEVRLWSLALGRIFVEPFCTLVSCSAMRFNSAGAMTSNRGVSYVGSDKSKVVACGSVNEEITSPRTLAK